MTSIQRGTAIHALIAYGHSAAKAIEIELDASRGDDFAVKYIKLVVDIVTADSLRPQKQQGMSWDEVTNLKPYKPSEPSNA